VQKPPSGVVIFPTISDLSIASTVIGSTDSSATMVFTIIIVGVQFRIMGLIRANLWYREPTWAVFVVPICNNSFHTVVGSAISSVNRVTISIGSGVFG